MDALEIYYNEINGQLDINVKIIRYDRGDEENVAINSHSSSHMYNLPLRQDAHFFMISNYDIF